MDIHSLGMNSVLYEEWHRLHVERCQIRKTPQRQRCTQGQQQNKNDSNLIDKTWQQHHFIIQQIFTHLEQLLF